jgi:uncharacterized protein
MDGEDTTALAGTDVGNSSRAEAFSSARLWTELAALFLGIPTLLILFRHYVNGLIIPLILLATFVCWQVLKRDAGFDRRLLWTGRDFAHHLRRTLTVFLPLGALAAWLSWLYLPGAFLAFPRTHFVFWLVVMLLYPVLSAYPQEIIYRTFFFHRYRRLFKSDRAMVVASALFFGAAHMFLGNWIAPVFAFVGGLLFGRTYLRSGSTLQAALEHGLWGDLLFTLGTGWFFYAGSI